MFAIVHFFDEGHKVYGINIIMTYMKQLDVVVSQTVCLWKSTVYRCELKGVLGDFFSFHWAQSCAGCLWPLVFSFRGADHYDLLCNATEHSATLIACALLCLLFRGADHYDLLCNSHKHRATQAAPDLLCLLLSLYTSDHAELYVNRSRVLF